MKLVAILIVGVGLALGGAAIVLHLPGSSANETFARLHGASAETDSHLVESGHAPSAAMRLMQTDTALCDQPYFIELYELNADYFAKGIDQASAEELEGIIFTHARESGHFTPEEAEGWIAHIQAIPGQFVDIYREDPTVLDNCYNFQVAAVGPPA